MKRCKRTEERRQSAWGCVTGYTNTGSLETIKHLSKED